MIRVAFGFLLHLSPARTTRTHSSSSSIRNQSGAAWEKRQLQSKFPLLLLPLLVPPSGCRLPVPRICWHILISFSLPSLPNSLYRARSPHNYYSVHIVAMPPLSSSAPSPLLPVRPRLIVVYEQVKALNNWFMHCKRDNWLVSRGSFPNLVWLEIWLNCCSIWGTLYWCSCYR